MNRSRGLLCFRSRHHIINMSSSSLKRKRDHPADSPDRQGAPGSDAKVPKRAFTRSRFQGFLY